MAQQKFRMHLYAYEEPDFLNDIGATKFRLVPWADTPTFGSYIGPREVMAEVPDVFDMRAAKLAAKQAELTKVRAEFTARITQLQREISELQAIEYTEVQS